DTGPGFHRRVAIHIRPDTGVGGQVIDLEAQDLIIQVDLTVGGGGVLHRHVQLWFLTGGEVRFVAAGGDDQIRQFAGVLRRTGRFRGFLRGALSCRHRGTGGILRAGGGCGSGGLRRGLRGDVHGVVQRGGGRGGVCLLGGFPTEGGQTP